MIDQGDFPEQLPLGQVPLVWFRLSRGRLRIETGSPERGVEEMLQVGETVRLVPFDNPSSVPWRRWAAKAFDFSTATTTRFRSQTKKPRSLAVGETRTPSAHRSPRSAWLRAARRSRPAPGGGRGAGRLRSSARARPRSRRPRRSAAPRQPADRGTPRLREGVDLARGVGAFGLASGLTKRSPPPVPNRGRSSRRGWTHSLRASGTWPARSRRNEQQGHRANALRHDQDRRGAPEPRLPQARDRLPRAAPQGPAESAAERGAHFRLVGRPLSGAGRTLGARLGSPPMRTGLFPDARERGLRTSRSKPCGASKTTIWRQT